MFTLTSPRLMFRNYTEQDLDFLQGMLASQEMMQYIGQGSTKTHQETAQFLQWIFGHYEEDERLGLKVIEHVPTNMRIGHAGIVPQMLQGQRHYEIGYWIIPEAQSNGYAKEAAQAFFRFGKTNLQLEKMIALIQPQNKFSVQVARSLPMQLEVEEQFNGQQVHIYSNISLDHK
ncbi:GNAT family N-acetyltransferase [Marinococcus halotolerans]|uniref:GNAT family N-acetyltransferase n=2 Tax=Marinococcus halotolerans TaxID=301092 RepID=UPI0003B488EA|nr:GNAT family N-acetyltransferase [Marinococcus halotolerans]